MRFYHVEFVYVILAMCSISVIVIVVRIILMAASSSLDGNETLLGL